MGGRSLCGATLKYVDNIMLELNNISVGFGGLKALSNVSISIARGQIHGIIGPNGAGKTTLLNVITGVFPPNSGDIVLDGISIRGFRTSEIAARGLGRTFQASKIFQGMTVLENVMCGLHGILKATPWAAAFGLGSVRDHERTAALDALAMLNFVGMEEFAHRDAAALSFGQQRLVEIARALISKPKVLLLDEPAVGLSAVRVDELGVLLKRIRDEHGTTIVMIEHVVQLVMGVCDRITVLNSGIKLAEGDAESIAREPSVIEAYLGKAIHA